MAGKMLVTGAMKLYGSEWGLDCDTWPNFYWNSSAIPLISNDNGC